MFSALISEYFFSNSFTQTSCFAIFSFEEISFPDKMYSSKLSDIQVVESLLKAKPYYTCKKGLPLLHSDFFCKCNILHIPELSLWSHISLIWTNRYLSTLNQSINCFSTNIKLNQFLYITLLVA